MTKKFIERLKAERIIDTKNYRYVIDGTKSKDYLSVILTQQQHSMAGKL